MPALFQLPDGLQSVLQESQIVIGGSADCHLRLKGLAPRHARVTEIAGRWLLESLGDWLLKVGNSKPSRKHWLTSGDRIYLAPSGPSIVFQIVASPSPATTRASDSSSTPPDGEAWEENEQGQRNVLQLMLGMMRDAASAMRSILRPRDANQPNDDDAVDG